MSYDRYIEIGRVAAVKDGWGATDKDAAGNFVLHEATWAELTAEGGTENKQAAAIVSVNTVVFTIRFIPGVKEDMVVRYDGEVYNIVHIAPEGRDKRLHIKAEIKR